MADKIIAPEDPKFLPQVLPPLASSRRINATKHWFVFCGVMTTGLWLLLFSAGLLIDSRYYTIAINYNFCDWKDWYWSLLTFTITNVGMLAFLAGLLGGICSKILVTEGFTISEIELNAMGTNYVLYENPFISAFRGTFMFVILLSIQYISSFTDLGNIGKQATDVTKRNQEEVDSLKYELKYLSKDKPKQNLPGDKKEEMLIRQMDTLFSKPDSGLSGKEKAKKLEQIDSLKDELNKLSNPTPEPDSIMVNRVFVLKDSILHHESLWVDKDSCNKCHCILANCRHYSASDVKIRSWKYEIGRLRRQIQPPPGAVNLGVTAASYFKFAVIISALAFMCGYDPALFNTFLSAFPFFSKKDKEDQNKPNPQ